MAKAKPLSTATYQRRIVAALKAQKRYNDALMPQIISLAIAWRGLAMLADDFDSIDTLIITETNRYGNLSQKAHPIIAQYEKIQRSTERQMAQLQLTASDLLTDASTDPLVELTEAVINAADGEIIFPQ